MAGGTMDRNKKESLTIYYCGREQCQPGHFWGPAVRPHYLLHVVLKGKGLFRYRNHTWHLGSGDAFLIHPMETHYYQADQQEPWEYAWVGFDGQAVEGLLEQTALKDSPVYQQNNSLGGSRETAASRDIGDSHTFGSSPSSCQQPRSGRSGCSQAILKLNEAFLGPDRNPLELTACLLLLFARMPRLADTSLSSMEEQYYRTAVEYIRNNYSYDLRIQDIAGFVGIDRTYLYKIFMHRSGIPPKQYLISYRIRCACALLQSQRYTITETAYSCGFRDTASFCNTFRQHMGVTPLQYKKQNAHWVQEPS